MEQNPLYQFTSLSRAINPFVYVTHRLLVILVPLAGVILGIYTLLIGGDFGSALVAGFYGGASAMLAWVLGREVDPDHPYSAFVALGLATIGAFFAVPNILALAGGVVLIRLVNRMVGLPPKISDYIIAVALGIITMLVTGIWTFGVVVALALLLDANLPDPAPLGYTFAFAMLLIMLPTWGYLNVALVDVSRDWLPPILAISALFVGHILTSKRFDSVCDATNIPPHPIRVRAGMGLMLVMAVMIGIIHGDGGTLGMMPLWTTFIGVMVYRGMMMSAKRG